jgi:hypothetical protein
MGTPKTQDLAGRTIVYAPEVIGKITTKVGELAALAMREAERAKLFPRITSRWAHVLRLTDEIEALLAEGEIEP